jgi:3-hydroxybutyryl-CoA dehydrogenase
MKRRAVGIVGLGLMGRGIAACMLSHGMRVVAYEVDRASVKKARRHIGKAVGELVDRGDIPASLRARWQKNYVEAASMTEFGRCDFVIESVVEDLATKRQVFDEIEAVVGSGVVIASNTSALPVSVLQKGRKHPVRFVGMHWAEPCHLTRFLEVVRGGQTDDVTVKATIALGKSAGKEPSLVNKDVDGFIVNRIGYAMYREAFWLLENGVADVETIDTAFRNSLSVWANIAGPFRWMDLTGIAAYAAVMQRLWPKLSRQTKVPRLMRELVDSGARGISNGRGFYKYTHQQSRRWEKRLAENVWKVREMLEQIPREPRK